MFADVGASSPFQRELVAALAHREPLAYPDRFEDAHRLAMRALEVLDRDGWRQPRLPRLGPLTGVAREGIERTARFIVKNHVRDTAVALERLYARREAQAAARTPARASLRRARLDAERVSAGYRGAKGGLPPVLLGGAALPVLGTLARSFGITHLSPVPTLVLALVLFSLFLLLSWILLRGAAVANRRIRLVARTPVDGLWATIGNAGTPPRDDSLLVAIVAIALTAVAWFVVPAVVAIVLALT